MGNMHVDSMDPPIISSQINSVQEGSWELKLKELGISLSDFVDGSVEALIRADIYWPEKCFEM